MSVKPLWIGVGCATGAHTHQEGELEHEDRYVHVQKGNFTFVVILVGVWCSGLSFFDSLLW